MLRRTFLKTLSALSRLSPGVRVRTDLRFPLGVGQGSVNGVAFARVGGRASSAPSGISASISSGVRSNHDGTSRRTRRSASASPAVGATSRARSSGSASEVLGEFTPSLL